VTRVRAPRGLARVRRAALSIVLASTVVAPAPAQQPAPAGAPRVRLGTAVTPDTVTVGDPFVVTVRVQAPPGAQVTFPAAPDSGAGVELLDPRRDRAAAADSGDVTATYRMAAWDVGTLPLRLGDVVVRVDGVERRVPLTALGVHVRSVLPADTALRVPKPAREPIADPGLWWLRWLLLALALLALLALLLWLARRWWRARRAAGKPDAAYAAALAAFERLDRLNLVASGEPGRHVALAEEILRDYLAARLPEATPSRTSSELRAALASRVEVPHERLAALLDTTDLVKFAAWPIAPAPAIAAGREARGIVDDVERAIREREAREREEAAARERAEREARRRYEEEQRRRSARGGDGSKDRAA
jgi:hypothetical protein